MGAESPYINRISWTVAVKRWHNLTIFYFIRSAETEPPLPSSMLHSTKTSFATIFLKVVLGNGSICMCYFVLENIYTLSYQSHCLPNARDSSSKQKVTQYLKAKDMLFVMLPYFILYLIDRVSMQNIQIWSEENPHTFQQLLLHNVKLGMLYWSRVSIYAGKALVLFLLWPCSTAVLFYLKWTCCILCTPRNINHFLVLWNRWI
jgi:hypothetical protein